MASADVVACVPTAIEDSPLADTRPGHAHSAVHAPTASYGPGKVVLEEGSIVGGYRIERKLAEGGMGTVYVASHVILPRRVALKVLRPELTDTVLARESLLQEGRILEGLMDARVARVFDAGFVEPGRPWMAMELVEGECLADMLQRKQRLSLGEVALIVCATVDALSAAHVNGVVHSDVKPENIMVQSGPYGVSVKMIDWGIAREAKKTRSENFAVGTPHYMAPEQVRGDPIDPRADIYALGVVTYELLAAKTPFNGDTPADIAMHHLRTVATPLRQVRNDVPPAIESLVGTMLAKDASSRPSLETVRACFGLVSDAQNLDLEDEVDMSVVLEMDAVPAAEEAAFAEELSMSDDVVHGGVVAPRWTPPHGRPTTDDISNRATLRFGRIVHSEGKNVASAAGTIRR